MTVTYAARSGLGSRLRPDRIGRAFACLFVTVGLMVPSAAGALTIVLDTLHNGDPPASTAPYLTATFATVVPGTVTLTLTSSLDITIEFIGGVGFNIDPLIVPSSISVVQGPPPPGTATVKSGLQDTQDMMGTGLIGKGWDFVLDFPTSGGPSGSTRFDGTDVAVFTLTGGSITEASFDFVNLNNGFTVGAHIQGIACTPTSTSPDCLPGGPGTTSGFVSAAVPEPAAGALLSMALVGFIWARSSRRS